jgi:hypothetical protein
MVSRYLRIFFIDGKSGRRRDDSRCLFGAKSLSNSQAVLRIGEPREKLFLIKHQQSARMLDGSA